MTIDTKRGMYILSVPMLACRAQESIITAGDAFAAAETAIRNAAKAAGYADLTPVVDRLLVSLAHLSRSADELTRAHDALTEAVTAVQDYLDALHRQEREVAS